MKYLLLLLMVGCVATKKDIAQEKVERTTTDSAHSEIIYELSTGTPTEKKALRQMVIDDQAANVAKDELDHAPGGEALFSILRPLVGGIPGGDLMLDLAMGALGIGMVYQRRKYTKERTKLAEMEPEAAKEYLKGKS